MQDQDNELSEVVDPPDAGPVEDQMFCFMDQERLCNASCMAYTSRQTGNPTYLESVQGHCLLLVSAERGGRSLNIIAGLLDRFVSSARSRAADEARKNSFVSKDVPSPGGTPR